MTKVRKAVIPAAGFGTRFLPFTKAVPKEMLPIVDVPTIEYIVREAIESGIEEVLIIINSEKECIKTHFGNNLVLEKFLEEKKQYEYLEVVRELPKLVKVYYTYQHEQLGLGHAVLCAKEFADGEPFALLLGDDVYVGEEIPATKQLIKAYEQTNCSVLGTLEVPLCDVVKYGICKPIDGQNGNFVRLESVVEKPKVSEAPSRLAIGGRYVLSPTIFKYLETQNRGLGNEIQLTDSIKRMMVEEDVYALSILGKRYDMGSKQGFLEATIDFALKRPDLKDFVKDLIKNK